MLDPETPFSDEEVRRILRRAADRQEEAERAELPAPGSRLTLDHLEEIAGGVGISPLHVQAAAQEVVLSRGAPPAPRRFGVPEALADHRVLPGDVSDARWSQMVALFRDTFRRNGVVSQFGEVREWASSSASEESVSITIRLEPGPGGTILSVRQSLRELNQFPPILGGSFLGVAILLLILFAAGDFADAVLWLPALFAGLGAASFGGAVVGLRSWSGRQRERIGVLLDRAELIQRSP